MSPLFSLLHSNVGWSLVAASFGDDEGVKTGWLILVLKVCVMPQIPGVR